MTDVPWYDYYLQFPVAGIDQALVFLDQVRAAGFMGGSGHLPDNMLGDARAADGSLYVPPADPDAPDTHAFTGRPGTATAGDPAVMYMQVRSPVSQAQSAALQAQLGLSPATYGITPADPAVVAQLMGVWA